jgi:aldehyde:ferredoxin oxidoreductase
VFNLPPELLREIYGVDIDHDPTSYNTKEIVVATHEDIYAVIDAVGICKFVCHGFNSPHLLKYEHFAQLLEKAFGARYTVEELRALGRRIVDLERAFINREGVRRPDDTLPRRYFEEPMPHGVARGHRIEREKFLAMLDRYYRLRRWNADGTVSDERIAELLAPWTSCAEGA